MALHQRETRACMPSLYQLVSCSHSHVLTARSRHLQTLSHAVHPSVAQKDENLTAPDQDYGGDGRAQSNQIWRLPPRFIDLCEGGHCCAESICLLDSC